jgi:hypothetical protein
MANTEMSDKLDELLKLVRANGIRHGIELERRRQQKLLAQRMQRQKPVAGFPFSLLEQLLRWAFGHGERSVARLVRWTERRFKR